MARNLCPRNNFSPCRDECELNEGGICADRLNARMLARIALQLQDLIETVKDDKIIDLGEHVQEAIVHLRDEDGGFEDITDAEIFDEDEEDYAPEEIFGEDEVVVDGELYIKLNGKEAEWGYCDFCNRSGFEQPLWFNDQSNKYYCANHFRKFILERNMTKEDEEEIKKLNLVREKAYQVVEWLKTIGFKSPKDNTIEIDDEIFEAVLQPSEELIECENCIHTNAEDFEMVFLPFWKKSDGNHLCCDCLERGILDIHGQSFRDGNKGATVGC